MRDVKFRAWDTRNNGFVTSPILVRNDGLVFSEYIGGGTVQKHLVLMQYTGLKDKNGKEIYEGDVVRICVEDDWNHSEDKLGEYYDYEPKVIEVRFDTRFGGYGFDGEELFGMEYTYPLLHDEFIVEIIGNIYENPELLHNDKK